MRWMGFMVIAESRPSWQPWGMRVVDTGVLDDARSRSARSLTQALAAVVMLC